MQNQRLTTILITFDYLQPCNPSKKLCIRMALSFCMQRMSPHSPNFRGDSEQFWVKIFIKLLTQV